MKSNTATAMVLSIIATVVVVMMAVDVNIVSAFTVTTKPAAHIARRTESSSSSSKICSHDGINRNDLTNNVHSHGQYDHHRRRRHEDENLVFCSHVSGQPSRRSFIDRSLMTTMIMMTASATTAAVTGSLLPTSPAYASGGKDILDGKGTLEYVKLFFGVCGYYDGGRNGEAIWNNNSHLLPATTHTHILNCTPFFLSFFLFTR